jgi:hypothetical protein
MRLESSGIRSQGPSAPFRISHGEQAVFIFHFESPTKRGPRRQFETTEAEIAEERGLLLIQGGATSIVLSGVMRRSNRHDRRSVVAGSSIGQSAFFGRRCGVAVGG